MKEMIDQAKALFYNYKSSFELYLKSEVARFDFEGNSLDAACKSALLSEGKRFRPTLLLLVANACGRFDVLESALSVELFHTASLMIDDLPCMDDEKKRRGQEATHSAFGEDVAILASYALISEAFDCIRRNAAIAKQSGHPFASQYDLGLLALENTCKNLGIHGLTGGQFLDLHEKRATEENVRKTLLMKTAALFETSFVLGWLFGGGDPQNLSVVKNLARSFGLAFQVADDIEDYSKDKELGRKMNLALVLGREKAKESFMCYMNEVEGFLDKLDIEKRELKLLCAYIRFKANS